jgi:CRP/FNR family transcriptional regulator, cyclic AMP receptor protein
VHHFVFSQGDPADAVFYILKGQVRVTMVSSQGKEAVIAIHGARNFFGQRCLTGVPHRIATVTTLTESSIMRIQKAAIIRAIHEEPAFAEMFIVHLLNRSIRIEADLIDQLFNSSERRLARLLVLLANFDKEGKQDQVIIKITQEILAEKIGTTRARVSHFMNKFRRLGCIDYKGDIRVHRSLSSLIQHDQPEIRT